MNSQQLEIYQQGYNAFLNGEIDTSNPYLSLEAEYWSDGWEDAQEDCQQTE